MNPIIKKLLLPFAVKLDHRMKQIDWGLENLHGIHLPPGTSWLNDISNDIKHFKANIFVDIGANRGSISQQLLSIDADASIHAFEPDPTLCGNLKTLFQRHEKVHIHQLALSGEDGSTEFRLYGDNKLNSIHSPGKDFFGGDVVQTISVSTAKLDTFFADSDQPIAFIKIDTQGHDLSVLHGAKEMLRSGKIQRILIELNFIELYQNQGNASAVIQFLEEYGFRIAGFYNLRYTSNRLGWCDALFKPSAK